MNNKEIKDLLYQVQCEFENEIDSYEYNGRELCEDDINMLFHFLQCYVGKMYAMIDDLEKSICIYCGKECEDFEATCCDSCFESQFKVRGVENE